jgi:hypothetical protein
MVKEDFSTPAGLGCKWDRITARADRERATFRARKCFTSYETTAHTLLLLDSAAECVLCAGARNFNRTLLRLAAGEARTVFSKSTRGVQNGFHAVVEFLAKLQTRSLNLPWCFDG